MMTRGTEDLTHGVCVDRTGYERFGKYVLRISVATFTLIKGRLFWVAGIF